LSLSPPTRHASGNGNEWISIAEALPENIQRWTGKRRAALVLSILLGETSLQEGARQHGLTVGEIEDWQERFLVAAENALRLRPKDEEALKDEQIKQLKENIGELVLDLDILREAMRGHPFGRMTSDE
jgi:transposase-like protein